MSSIRAALRQMPQSRPEGQTAERGRIGDGSVGHEARATAVGVVAAGGATDP